MSKPVLDHTQDLSGAETHRLTQLYTPPEFVKTASHDALHGDPEIMRPHMYADATNRIGPLHTKAATWMTALFFKDNERRLAPSAAEVYRNRIIKQASYFNIKPEVESLWERMEKEAAAGMSQLPDSHFALVWVEADGSKHRNYPIDNPTRIKQASEWFGKYHNEFTWPDKHQIASKIVARAEEDGVPITNSELLLKCAGFGYCSAADAAEAWEKRAALVRMRNPEQSEGAATLAKVAREATFEARDQGIRLKMAELMDRFDRECHLTALYEDGGLLRPEDCLFMITEKVASEFLVSNVQTTTGAIYEKTALEKLSLDDVSRWMGQDFADEVAAGGVMLDMDKLAELLPTMPRDDAEMFEQMARSVDIAPMAREKAAAAVGMSDEDRADLAAQYQHANNGTLDL